MSEKTHPPSDLQPGSAPYPIDGTSSSSASAPPSTPPQTNEILVGTGAGVAPAPQPPPPGFSEPPPSYQAAMSYPTQQPPYPPAGAGQPPYPMDAGHPPYPVGAAGHQPAANPAFVKFPPNSAGVPPVGAGATVAPPTYGSYEPNTSAAYPQMPPQPVYQIPQQAPPTAIIVNVGPPGLECAYCGGTVVKETDLCCLLSLIFLAIFTFPFGLPFLCCIPCTVRRRCERCNRVG